MAANPRREKIWKTFERINKTADKLLRVASGTVRESDRQIRHLTLESEAGSSVYSGYIGDDSIVSRESSSSIVGSPLDSGYIASQHDITNDIRDLTSDYLEQSCGPPLETQSAVFPTTPPRLFEWPGNNAVSRSSCSSVANHIRQMSASTTTSSVYPISPYTITIGTAKPYLYPFGLRLPSGEEPDPMDYDWSESVVEALNGVASRYAATPESSRRRKRVKLDSIDSGMASLLDDRCSDSQNDLGPFDGPAYARRDGVPDFTACFGLATRKSAAPSPTPLQEKMKRKRNSLSTFSLPEREDVTEVRGQQKIVTICDPAKLLDQRRFSSDGRGNSWSKDEAGKCIHSKVGDRGSQVKDQNLWPQPLFATRPTSLWDQQ